MKTLKRSIVAGVCLSCGVIGFMRDAVADGLRPTPNQTVIIGAADWPGAMGARREALVMGGVSGGQILRPGVVGDQLEGGEIYTLYGPYGAVGRVRGGKPAELDQQCSRTYHRLVDSRTIPIAVADPENPDFADPNGGFGYVGIAGERQGQHRPPQFIDPDDDGHLYKAVIRDIAAQRGVFAEPVIEDIMAVDLDGNGNDEIIVQAFSTAGDGWFSLVMIRKICGDEVRHFILEEISIFEANDDCASTNDPAANAGHEDRTWLRVSAIIDVTGDGTMELFAQVDGGNFRGVYMYSIYDKGASLLLNAFQRD